MPLYLYALIGALVFAIAHGMHFTVPALQHTMAEAALQAPRGAQVARAKWRSSDKIGWFRADQARADARIADIGY